MSEFMETVQPFLISVLLFIVGIVLTWIAGSWAGSLTQRALAKGKVDIALQRFLGKIVRWLILVAGTISCLGIFGIQTASFAAILGAIGFAIGMALKGTLGNFASGVMLLIFRPFKVDDVVSMAGVTGKVVEIDIYATVLTTPDNRRIIVPNGAVFSGTIENLTFNKTRRVDVGVGTDYAADLQKVRSTLLNAATETKWVQSDPAPVVVLLDLGASSINWSVRAWTETDKYWDVKDELTKNIKNALDKEKVGIPFPQMDLHINSSMKNFLERSNGKESEDYLS
ncbi:MAG: mechanosensitive ion channel family protein [Bdellovibrionales bacterium]|nr:mechanosensitive ion channel family protein [Bdellovibrionales bacterium]